MASYVACLETGRYCISIESDGECFRYGLARSRIFATPNATMKDLEIYVDHVQPTQKSNDGDREMIPSPLKKRKGGE